MENINLIDIIKEMSSTKITSIEFVDYISIVERKTKSPIYIEGDVDSCEFVDYISTLKRKTKSPIYIEGDVVHNFVFGWAIYKSGEFVEMSKEEFELFKNIRCNKGKNWNIKYAK